MPERTAADRTSGAAAPPSALLVLPMFLVAAGVFWLLHRRDFSLWWLEDLPVYSRAVQDFLAGKSPYNSAMSPLFFVYPPIFLYLAGLLSHLFPNGWGAGAYVGAHLVAICAIPLVLARYFFRLAWLTPLFALLLFFAEPRFDGMLALCGANVASILYLLAFVAAVPGLRKNLWTFFYLAVLLAAVIKITFLALLLLPLLVGRAQWWRCVACGALAVAVNVMEKVLDPSLYAGYQWSVLQGVIVQRHYGYGVFGVLAYYDDKLHHAVGKGPYAVAVLMAVAIVAGLYWLRWRLDRDEAGWMDAGTARAVWIGLVVMAVVLVDPREMQYDVDVAMLAAFVVIAVVLQVRWLLLLPVVLFLPSLLMPLLQHVPQLDGFYETCVVIAAFGLGFWWLWRSPSPAGASAAGATIR